MNIQEQHMEEASLDISLDGVDIEGPEWFIIVLALIVAAVVIKFAKIKYGRK